MTTIDQIQREFDKPSYLVGMKITDSLDLLIQRQSEDDPIENYFVLNGRSIWIPSDEIFHPSTYEYDVPWDVIEQLEETCLKFSPRMRDICYKELQKGYNLCFGPDNPVLAAKDSMPALWDDIESTYALWSFLLITIDDTYSNLDDMAQYLTEDECTSEIINEHRKFYLRVRNIVGKGHAASRVFHETFSDAIDFMYRD